MDTLTKALATSNNEIGWSFVFDFLKQHFATPEMAGAVTLVILIETVLMYLTPKWSDDVYKYLTFVISCAVSFIFVKFEWTAKFAMVYIGMTSLTFLFWTLIGSKLIPKWIKKLQIKTGAIDKEEILKPELTQKDASVLSDAKDVINKIEETKSK